MTDCEHDPPVADTWWQYEVERLLGVTPGSMDFWRAYHTDAYLHAAVTVIRQMIDPGRVIERVSDHELAGEFSARVWAEQFFDRFRGRTIGPDGVDEGTMIVWFANAIMAGYDERDRRARDRGGY